MYVHPPNNKEWVALKGDCSLNADAVSEKKMKDNVCSQEVLIKKYQAWNFVLKEARPIGLCNGLSPLMYEKGTPIRKFTKKINGIF